MLSIQLKSYILNLKSYFLNLLPFILVFAATLAHPIDFDLGWHLRFGQDIWDTGQMVYENTYSTEMVGFKWFNSSWLLDVIRYPFWQATGFWGHAILGSVVVVFTFFIISKYLKLSLFAQSLLFPLLLWMENPFYLHSFRAQGLSLLFLSILMAILWKYQKTHTRLVFSLIPLFFLWANIHAQFVLGLGIFAVWVFVFLFQSIEKGIKKHLFPLGFTLIASLMVTLINPYGVVVYSEAITITGSPAIQFIIEFSAPLTYSLTWWNLIVWGILLLINLIFIIKKKTLKLYIPYIIIGMPLYIVSFFMTRYHWSMYILTVPLVAFLINQFRPKNIFISQILPSFLILLSIFFVIVWIWPYRNLKNMSWTSFCEYNECSFAGVKKLKSMKNPGRIYTDYNHGGWLIWNFPEVKPGVDGRMSQWTDKSGYSAFIRYIMLENNRNYVELSPFDTYFIRNVRPLINQLEQLVKMKKFRLVFRDKFTSIYTRAK